MKDYGQFFLQEIFTPARIEDIYAGFHDLPYSFFLDSNDRSDRFGQYSFLGANPFLIFVFDRGKIKYCEKGQWKVSRKRNPFKFLRNILNTYRIEPRDDISPFLSGGVGYFSYDLNRYLEKLPALARDDLNIPEICLAFYDTIMVFDHVNRKTFIVSSHFGNKDWKYAQEKILFYVKHISRAEKPRKKENVRSVKFDGQLKSNFTRSDYIRTIQKTIDYIYAGDIFQANISQRFETRFEGDAYELYRRLRKINPAPFSGYLNFGEVKILSSSPERFLQVRGREVETVPIKGTRPRSADPAEDRRLSEELLTSEKDSAELTMIVDLERNDLGRVCEFGSVIVEKHKFLRSYETVHHLLSTVKGRLERKNDIVDLLQATFPGGSITGAPKVRAMEIIEELEPTRRAIYTGSIGYISFSGNMDIDIVIRTILIKGNRLYYNVGGGIVADSVPEAEYFETMDKGYALAKAISSYFGK